MIASVSRESVRQILRAGGVSWQATKIWEVPDDPDFIAKMAGCWTFTATRPLVAG